LVDPDDPDAVILTDTVSWQFLKPSAAEFVEMSFCCPLSMIPTLYGLKLLDNVRLGSSVPVKVWREVPKSTPLRWQRALHYSTNVQLDLSPALKNAINRLKELCLYEEPVLIRSGKCPVSC
jgi:hypothetical protein